MSRADLKPLQLWARPPRLDLNILALHLPTTYSDNPALCEPMLDKVTYAVNPNNRERQFPPSEHETHVSVHS